MSFLLRNLFQLQIGQFPVEKNFLNYFVFVRSTSSNQDKYFPLTLIVPSLQCPSQAVLYLCVNEYIIYPGKSTWLNYSRSSSLSRALSSLFPYFHNLMSLWTGESKVIPHATGTSFLASDQAVDSVAAIQS